MRFITSRNFFYSTGSRQHGFMVNKNHLRKLHFIVKYERGFMAFVLKNKEKGIVYNEIVNSNKEFTFELQKGEKYYLEVVTQRACGAYKIMMEVY